jgi:hypothetical protein
LFWPFIFAVGLVGAGVMSTSWFENLMILSLLRVSTGDHSISSWLGGGISVIRRGTDLD